MISKTQISSRIKELAVAQGFDKVGIAPAQILDRADFLREWIRGGYHGSMYWMEQYLDKRLDIRKLYPQAASVISVAQNYYTEHQHSNNPSNGKISRYGWGRDYHSIMKKGLKALLREIRKLDETIEGRLFVDTAPIQDKLWARQAGLGWQGKNTNILTRDFGSWVFLGELVINRVLTYDQPAEDFCGSCTACIDACPTNALLPYQIDARRCISYQTIENRSGEIPKELAGSLDNWIFGCDICQDVCPWNRFARPARDMRYQPEEDNVSPDLSNLAKMSEPEFKRRFRKSPVYRARFSGFLRNVKTVMKATRKKAPVHATDPKNKKGPESV